MRTSLDPIFETEEERSRSRSFIFSLISTITIGIPLLFYEEFMIPHYCRNRKALLNIIKNREYTHLQYSHTFGRIDVYDLVIGEESYVIWVYEKGQVTLAGADVDLKRLDLIGLFTSSLRQKRINREIKSELIKLI